MKEYIAERVYETAELINATGCTMRVAAKQIGVAKSTVHKDIEERLPKLDPILYKEVRAKVLINKEERSRRGGLATSRLYRAARRDKATN